MATTLIYFLPLITPSSGLLQQCTQRTCTEDLVSYCVVNASSQKCTSACFERQNIPKGHMTTIDGNSGNLNAVPCSSGSYQPHDVLPGDKCWCQPHSQCTGEGQIVSSNGSTTKDRTCRCDYTKKYGYAQKPNDICECKPRIENCHCVLISCPSGKKLSPDYLCVANDNLNSGNFNCPAIMTSNRVEPNLTHSNTENTDRKKGHNYNCNCDVSVPIIVAAICTLFGIVIGMCLERKKVWTKFHGTCVQRKKFWSKFHDNKNSGKVKTTQEADVLINDGENPKPNENCISDNKNNGKDINTQQAVVFINDDQKPIPKENVISDKNYRKGNIIGLPPRKD